MNINFETNTRGVNRFTINARKAIDQGFSIAKEFNYKEYLAIHLFYILLNDRNGLVADIFNRLGVDIDSSLGRISEEFNKYKLANDDYSGIQNTVFSNELKELINQSFVVASNLGHVYVGTEHLLLAMFNLKDINFIEDLKKLGITFDSLKKTLLSISNYSLLANSMKGEMIQDQFDSRQSVLPSFSRNMNEMALNGELPNITGRDKEIRRLIHILARKTKNNPILVGDAGVGKTAIVEGFVNAIVQKKVPASFLNSRVISLDIGSILSGAKLRGDVEERVGAVINEAMNDGSTIIFIDEIHNIVGAGSAGGKDSMDIANMLKPYLTNSGLSIIGATTADEYAKYFESDSALTRRFQPINVEELNIDSAKQVLYKVAPELESYHKVKITKEAVDIAVDLSSKFIRDRYLPDKAIDLLDESAASIKVGREIAMEPELTSLGDKLIKIQKKKEEALKKDDFKSAANYKKEIDQLVDEIESIVEGKKKINKKYSKVVTEDLIKEIIVEWTKIPIAASDISDKRLKDLNSHLKKKIVGQDRVIDNVALAIQRSHLGLGGENRPLASFMFLGPTGVGKTELAKSLAKELFGSDNLLYQINMSEFMEMHSVAKLIGSPPGYVGYQEGGQLTTYVKRKPYSVILFDEIEKAHPDVLNILLQILEEGELTDGKGLKVSLRNCIVVMTSNIGATDISHDSRLGFDINIESQDKKEMDGAYEDMKNQIMETLRNTLRPELLNRIDLIDIFRGLNKEDSLEIAKIQVDDLTLRLLPKGIILQVDEAVINKINDEGYSKEYGGRNIRRKVQEILENGIAQFLLKTKVEKKRKTMMEIKAGLKDGDVTFSII